MRWGTGSTTDVNAALPTRSQRDSGYARWWAKAIYLDGDGLLHEGWFPAARVKPAPYAEPDESY